MSKYEVGDFVQVIDNKHGMMHFFPIGSVAKVWRIYDNGEYGCWGINDFGTELQQRVHEKNLIPFSLEEEETKSKVIRLKSNSLAQFIRIGDVVISFPKDIPIGIATCHDDDEFCEACGKGIAFERLIENVNNLF